MFDPHQRSRPWLKVVLWVAVPCVVVFAMCMHMRQSYVNFQKVLYPVAPQMPAVVSASMPEVLAEVESALKTNAPHVLHYLQPRLSAAEIARLELQYRVRLPDEIKLIYEWHNGSVEATNYALSGDFIPSHRFLPLAEALEERTMVGAEKVPRLQRAVVHSLIGFRESWVCLFSDGAGDGYWYDLKRKPAEGAVFYNFTEDGSYTFFPSPKNLMAGIAKGYEAKLFFLKTNSPAPELDEHFDRADAFWAEFGSSGTPK